MDGLLACMKEVPGNAACSGAWVFVFFSAENLFVHFSFFNSSMLALFNWFDGGGGKLVGEKRKERRWVMMVWLLREYLGLLDLTYLALGLGL